MAKRQRFRRDVGGDGKVRYFELQKDKRGVLVYKRISDKKGAKEFVKRNYDKIKNDYTQLTQKEVNSVKRSKKQRNLFRWDGKAIPKKVTDLLIQDGIIKKDSPRELKDSNLKKIKRVTDIEREYKRILNAKSEGTAESTYGNSGYRGRDRVESLVSLNEEISRWTNDGYKFVVYDNSGTPYYGIKAWNQIRNFETDYLATQFERNEVAFVRFPYNFYVDSKTKQVEVYLADTIPQPMTSDPLTRFKMTIK